MREKQQIIVIKLLNMLIGRIENRSIVIYSTADHVTEALEQQNCPRRQVCLNFSVFFVVIV